MAFCPGHSGVRLFFVVWLLCVGLGTYKLIDYAGTAGGSPHTDELNVHWPKGSTIQRGSRPSFVLFAHPRCSCSMASLGELEYLMPLFKDRVDVTVVFVQPKGHTLAWTQDALWEKAVAIPGVRLVVDPDGAEAARFGAQTSGHSFLYNSRGGLVFSGGITPARGHMGSNKGRDFITAWTRGKQGGRQISSVFGCGLTRGDSQ